MKKFFQFIQEAAESQAASRAHKLGLTGDGHGSWKDRSGKTVARTEKGKLKFIDGRQSPEEQTPSTGRQPATSALSPLQPQVDSEPAPMDPQTQGAEPEQQEQETQPLTVVFGRFNPPTVGHEKLLRSAKRISVGGDIKIYPSRTQDPKKNPLDPDMKISYMKKMFPEYADDIINDHNMKTIFNVLVAAQEEGYTSVNIVVGSDRQSEFENLAQKYNGGDLYSFDQINVISAGVRDADSEGVEGMSASKMRQAVASDDFAAFRRGTPRSLDDAETRTLFDAVRQGMGIKKNKVQKENHNMWEIAPKYDMKNLRENYLTGLIFRLGDTVQNLNTGLIGEVIRRGTNHLICVTEEGYMFKSWIKDLMEYTEVEMDSIERERGKPNTLVGTTGYLKYAASMTPGAIGVNDQYLQPGAKSYKTNLLNKYKESKTTCS
jgi:hypothetical protein